METDDLWVQKWILCTIFWRVIAVNWQKNALNTHAGWWNYTFFFYISLEKRAVFPGPSDFLHSSSKSLVSLPIILPIKSQFWAYSQELVSKPTPCPWQRGGKKVTPSAHPKGPKTEFEYTPCWRVGAGGKKGEEMLESQDRVVLGHGQSPLLFIPGLWCHVC